MKLIPMVSFVKKQGNIGMEIQSISHQQSDRARRFYLIQKYADFLLKDIGIGMVVPCDEFDNILEEPNQDNYAFCSVNGENYEYDLLKYQHEKYRVLFKGFKVRDYKHGSLYSKTITDETGLIHLFWFDKITETWSLSHGLTTIENLAIFNSIELTETALKEIGLPESKKND
jgi:hypothetical protein